MTCSEVQTTLETVLPGAVFRHSMDAGVKRGIVWSETGFRLAHGDNGPRLSALRFTVLLVTQTDDDPALQTLLSTLANNLIAFTDPETSYDEDRAALTHTLNCEVRYG